MTFCGKKCTKVVEVIGLKIAAQAVEIIHDLLQKIVLPGDTVIDATAGNGGDTLFLAQLVGANGKVYAFDIQAEALQTTRKRLQEAGYLNRVCLLQTGHENLDQFATGRLRCAVFNLGYLPGGAKAVVTKGRTTLAALEICLKRLLPGGIVLLTVYWGHPGGQEEKQILAEYTAGLAKQEWDVTATSFPNRERAPIILAIQKRGGE